jgi:transcriptional regulator with XRE-family HTH domain
MVADDPVNAVFAASLTRIRTERGLTKKALAVRSGIDQTGIGKIEAGVGGTTLRTAGMLAGALGTTPAEMLAPVPAAMAETRKVLGEVLDWLDNPAVERPPAAVREAWRKRAGMMS